MVNMGKSNFSCSELKHRDTFACLRDVWCKKIEDPPKDRPVMGIYFFRNLKQHD